MMSRTTDRLCLSSGSRPLGAVALLTASCVATPAAAQAPSMIIMPGVVRDFQKGHPDFNIVPAGGYGHYAGNVDLTIGADQKPAYLGTGFRVGAEWTDLSTNNIAPHLYTSASEVPLGSVPVLDAGASADTWDSSLGTYALQVPGPAPTYNTSAPMPSVSAPSPFIASSGDVSYRSTDNGQPPNEIRNDIHCNNFTTQKDTNLVINGTVTILCEGDFTPNQNSHITLLPGSSLKIYFRGLFLIKQGSSINMPPINPSDVWIYNLGTTQMEINQSSAVAAIIISPDAPLHLAQGDQFFGKFIGTGLQQDQFSGFHWDTAPWRDQCTNILEDNKGTDTGNFTGGITSPATFGEWYNDTLGVNLSQIYLLRMQRDVTGVYTTSLPEFHPIDDRLYGNEGEDHNYFFTYEFNANFVYDACTKQYLRFRGSDDVWVYIDGNLVIDLAGVIPGEDQVIQLDRLGLTDGEGYVLKFFYAQRQMTDTSFELETNAVLLPPVLTASGTAGFD